MPGLLLDARRTGNPPFVNEAGNQNLKGRATARGIPLNDFLKRLRHP
jgi:hypothetical protein